MLNSEFIKYGTVNLEGITVIHLKGDFDSVLNLLQGQVTSDCTLINNQLGQMNDFFEPHKFTECTDQVMDYNA